MEPIDPPRTTRQILLDTGRAIAIESGLRSLTIRGLADTTGINLGSFVYHFRNREAFISEIIETWYAPLLTELEWHLSHEDSALERLRAMLLQASGFVNQHGRFIAQLLMDALAGEKAVRAFLSGLSTRHFGLLEQGVIRAQQAGEICADDARHVLTMLLAAIGAPLLLQHLLGDQPVVPELMRDALARFGADPRAIERRLDWALKGLRP